MSNLLKVDLFRFLKSKQFIIASIVSVLVAIFIPLLYFAIEKGLNAIIGSTLEDGENAGQVLSIYAKDFAFAGIGSVNSLNGISISFIVTAILFTVAIGKEFTFGIVRNKIIAGHSRVEIYLSLFITLYIFMFGIAFISSLIGFFTGILLFPYDADGNFFSDFIRILTHDFGNFMLGTLFGALGYVFLTSFICFFAIGLDKTALAIILSILLSVMSLFICGVLIGPFIPVVAEYSDIWKNIMIFINTNNPFYSFNYFTLYGYKLYQILSFLISPMCWSALLTFLGIVIFNKKDLK